MIYPNKEATMFAKIIKSGESFIPELPVKPLMCLVYCDGKNYYCDELPESTLGKYCICHIVYDKNDSVLTEKSKGFLGVGFEATMTHEYKSIVSQSYNDDGEIVYPWAFLSPTYKDA
jgi:hypothetical protein